MVQNSDGTWSVNPKPVIHQTNCFEHEDPKNSAAQAEDRLRYATPFDGLGPRQREDPT